MTPDEMRDLARQFERNALSELARRHLFDLDYSDGYAAGQRNAARVLRLRAAEREGYMVDGMAHLGGEYTDWGPRSPRYRYRWAA